MKILHKNSQFIETMVCAGLLLATNSFVVAQVAFVKQPDLPVGSEPFSITSADFNGDNKNDLAVVNHGNNTISIFLNNGNAGFQPQVTYPAGPIGPGGGVPLSLAVGDFNNDNKIDLAVTNLDSKTVSTLMGNGDGTFQPYSSTATVSAPFAITSGKFNNDQNMDIAVTRTPVNNNNTISVLLGNGDGTFKSEIFYTVGKNPSSLSIGDFNGDGKSDLVTLNTGSSDISILLGNGDGTFQAHLDYVPSGTPTAVTASDLNSDGFSDLAIGISGSTGILVMLNRADGSNGFDEVAHNLNAIGGSAIDIKTADVNNDGKLDVIAFNSDRNLYIFLNKGNGNFSPQDAISFGNIGNSSPRSAAVADFDGDNRNDVAIANQSNDNVSVLINDQLFWGDFE